VVLGGAADRRRLTALANETLSHTPARDEFTGTATLPARTRYWVPNDTTVQRLVRSDIGTNSYARASGTFALGTATDETAYALKMAFFAGVSGIGAGPGLRQKVGHSAGRLGGECGFSCDGKTGERGAYYSG
jgi:hypothetical protein